jgi:hypothetical protein
MAFLLLAGSVGGFIMGLLGMTFAGVLRANGWIPLSIFGAFSLVYSYMLFLQPKPSEAKTLAPRRPKVTPVANSDKPK